MKFSITVCIYTSYLCIEVYDDRELVYVVVDCRVVACDIIII